MLFSSIYSRFNFLFFALLEFYVFIHLTVFYFLLELNQILYESQAELLRTKDTVNILGLYMDAYTYYASNK